jgi:hypothetical protein
MEGKMDLRFLKRELKKEKIEWGITPIYLIAIREKDPLIWQEFVDMINAIDDKSLDRAFEDQRNKLKEL